MRDVSVFLASSTKLREERGEFSVLMDKLANVAQDLSQIVPGTEDIFLDPVICETESYAMEVGRKQEGYNRKIRTSDATIVLLEDGLGDYTLEELRVACEACMSRPRRGKPEVHLMVKAGMPWQPDIRQLLDPSLSDMIHIHPFMTTTQLMYEIAHVIACLCPTIPFSVVEDQNGPWLTVGKEQMTTPLVRLDDMKLDLEASAWLKTLVSCQ